MKVKRLYEQMTNNIQAIWRKGKIQRTFNITYDVIWNVVLFFLVLGFIGLFFTGGIGAGYFASLVKDEPIRSYQSMEKDIYNYEETSKFYFAEDVYFGDVRAELYREEVALEDVPDILVKSVMATEDQNFYDHKGVVPKAIIRAVLQEAINANVKTGGSTLTQQLIKNQMLTNEVSFDRKAKEILLALRLEHFFEKEEILEAYLNIIPYGRNSSGRNIAGIQTAAQGIFGVDVDEVNIPQAAFLSGLPQSPSVYTPFISGGGLKDENGLESGLNRMKTVLKRMYDAQFITKDDYEKALDYDIVADFREPKKSPQEDYPRLTEELERRAKDILLEKVAEEDGYALEDLEKNEQLMSEYKENVDRNLRIRGYNIHSTVNKDIYDKMQDVMKNHEYFGPDRKLSEKDKKTGETVEWTEQQQAGGVLIENKTGKILSFVGGRDFEDSEINYATRAERSPGSTFKPLVVYAPGIELGKLQPGTPLSDHKNTFNFPGGGSWTLNNYSTGRYGIVSAREALTQSHNIQTVAAYRSIYSENPAEQFIGKMWTPSKKDDLYLPSLSVGAPEITVEDNTNMFSTLGNGGQFNDSYMIEKITNQDGDIIYEHESDPVDVFSSETAYLTLDMMRDVISSGTGTFVKSYIQDHSVDWAGKTGTSEEHRDAWFMGVNPNVTFGAWTGYDTSTEIGQGYQHPNMTHSERIIKLWSELVNGAAEVNPDLVTPQENFNRPDGIVERSICSISGLLPSDLCKDAGLITSDLFNEKHVPTKTDDSLKKGSYVRINGKTIMAGDNTPAEFIAGDGFSFNSKFLEREGYDNLSDITQLYPRKNRDLWQKIGMPSEDASDSIKDDGKKPNPPTSLQKNSKQISWQSSNSSDVVGYRIYKASKPGGSFSQVDHTRRDVYDVESNNAVYYLTAVDYFGLESSPSEEIIIGDVSDKDDKKQKKDEDNKEKDKNKDKAKENDKEKKDKEKEKTKEDNKNKEKDKDDDKEDNKENKEDD